MIEFDTQIIPMARAMSFLFWACSAFKVRKEFYVTLLHAGNNDIDFEYGEREEDRDYDYDFELRVHACNSFGAWWVTPHGDERITEHVRVCIDIKTLCDALCEEAERFMQHVSEEELEGHSVRIVDVAEFARLNHR